MTGNNKLIYLYDDTGTPYGYIYNDTSYYYEKNAQGDVVGLYYQNGIKIANYTYDAWGNVTSIINQYGEDVTGLPRHQGNLNPIRYRGYYYDVELEMYWLTTRFYDPQTGRFINADGQLNGGMFGNNLYAYCSNDPVNCVDPTGREEYEYGCPHTSGMFECGYCMMAREAYNTPIVENITYIIDCYSDEWWIEYHFTAVRQQGIWVSAGDVLVEFKVRDDFWYNACVGVLDALFVYTKYKCGTHAEKITIEGGRLTLYTEVEIISYYDLKIDFFGADITIVEIPVGLISFWHSMPYYVEEYY